MIISKSKKLNNIQIPSYDGELSMCPFNLGDVSSVPLQFRETVRTMIDQLPNKIGEAFLTVHGAYIEKTKTLRRGAPHIDGNYLPEVASWGSGGGNGWKVGENGVKLNSKEHAISYENTKGGMLIASDYASCMGWNGEYEGASGVGGDCSHLNLQEGFKLEPNTVYYGNSQFIHESLPLDKSTHRTLYRITLPVNYDTQL